MRIFIEYLFNSKQIMRVQFLTRVDNRSMVTIGEKVGFISEGILRKYRFEQGEYRDFYMMAITREEWVLKKIP